VNVAIYARVSTERQHDRGTIGSQLAALRQRAATEGDQVAAEFCDDGYSGARLDRPGLDGLRDAAEAGLIQTVWCLSPDRLSRVYAYQVIVLDELARHGVTVRFADAPAIDDDPQARLLTQVQGVIAEYERAKIAERYRRGKLWRSRAGEVISWKAAYGYRRIPRSEHRPAHLVVYESEAQVVRRIFDDYTAGGHSMRQITRRLNADQVPTPTGKPVWGVSTIGRLLRNHAYIGRVYYNRTETVPTTRPGHRPTRQRPRTHEEWIPITVPPIVADDIFQAAQQVSRDNTQWSPAAPNPASGCCAAWSPAAPARSASTATRCAAATAPSTATTTAATTTRYAPAASIAAAPSATSAPTPWTPSSPTRSARRCDAPRCCWPANTPSPSAPQHPTTNCWTPSSPGWTARPKPPKSNAAGWSTATRPGCWTWSSCNAAPKTSTPASSTPPSSATRWPPNARRSPPTTGCANASAPSPTRSWQPSTTSTSTNTSSCYAWSSRRSASPAGTSTSACASPSTTPRHPTNPPARRTRQAKTVCVPLVAINGPSYRLKDRLKPSNGGGALE
jgi:DNA invertase Pin-like site-specific DNA recombinase